MQAVKWTHRGYFNLIGFLRHNSGKLGLSRAYHSFVFNLPFMTVIHIKVR